MPESIATRPSAGYSIKVRIEIERLPGVMGRVTGLIDQVGGDLDELRLIDSTPRSLLHELTVKAGDAIQADRVIEGLRSLSGISVLDVKDRTFALHSGGKITVNSALEVRNDDDLAMAYTPGVGRVCMAIHEDPQLAYELTIKQNTVAVVTDGTAVLGLGDIGPGPAQPVMEGKALIFREFAGINAFPICLDTKKTDEIVAAVKAIAPVFGGINLEDISAPRCFEIEEKCQEELDIPVFHDDQHGTAVVVLAAMINALKVVNKNLADVRIVILGTGASGVAVAKLLMLGGARDLVACDRAGALFRGRSENMNPIKQWLAEHSNPDRQQGPISAIIKGADVFIGLSGPKMLTVDDLKGMNKDAIVFAMANPIPEIMPEEAAPFVRVMATGRSDYPNQINNASCFPGFFRGMLDVRATRVNDQMKLAAANALAAIVPDSELAEDYILPSVFNPLIVPTIASAVGRAAIESGVAGARSPAKPKQNEFSHPTPPGGKVP